MPYDPGTIGFRPTWAEVNLDNLSHNLRQVRRCLGAHTRIMACVKADAYGHGLLPVARRLVDDGVECLAVASIDEAIRLRRAEVYVPILILGVVLERDIEPLFRYALTPTVCTRTFLAALERAGRRFDKHIAVHLKVDTGMGRIGVALDQAPDIVRSFKKYPHLRLEGIFTHLASADCDRRATARQLRAFQTLVAGCRQEGIVIPQVHAANSMGAVAYRSSHFTMVRPGLVLYGLYPSKGLRIRLKPVLSLKTAVVFTKQVPAGTGISYGRAYVTRKSGSVATLPIGYGDGYPRNLTNIGPVLIRGRKFRISGRVCMDQIMVDTGPVKVKPGDPAVLIGSMGRNTITAEELAKLSGTISYEIVCGLGSRVPRLYKHRDTSGVRKGGKTAGQGSVGEKRDFVRYNCSVPLAIARRCDPRQSYDVLARDISANGLGIVSSQPLDPKEEYDLVLASAGASGQPVRSRCRLVWWQQDDPRVFRGGLSLVNPDLMDVCKGFAAVD